MHVLICDDHTLFADSFAQVLQDRGYTITAVTSSPDAAIAVLRESVVRGSAVDVCVLDLNFPSGSVLSRLPELRRAAPTAGLVLLTGYLEREVALAAEAAGVLGFAHKGQRVEDITAVIDRVHVGRPAGEVPARAQPRGPAARPARTGAKHLAGFLTAREREVLECLVRGEDTMGLARTLNITRNTARCHIQSVLTKLGVHSRLEAAAVAVRHGLVSAEDGCWVMD